MNALLQILGTGKAKDAGNDISLRERWMKLKEQEAMGEIPQLPDYNTWKAQYLRTQG